MRFQRLLITTLLAGFISSNPPAQAQEDLLDSLMPKLGDEATSDTVATLVPEVKSVAPGKPFSVALKLQHPAGWHSYYLNSGGIEKSPEIKWTLPEGFTASELQWPTPEVTDGLFGKSFSYSGTPVFLTEITPPANLPAGSTITLKASAVWQICREGQCRDEPKDGPAKFEIALPVNASSEPDPTQVPLFAAARAEIPQPAKDWSVTAETSGTELRLRLKGVTADLSQASLTFIPDYPFIALALDGAGLTRDGDDWLLTLKRVTKDPVLDQPVPQGKEIAGVLVGKSAITGESKVVQVPPTKIGKAPAAPLSLAAFLPVLGGMLLGGLILNLMPCVFPVIGLKIMGFVQQSGQDRKKIVLHGLAFTAGVLISFWALSGVLFALRSAAGPGQEIGWGYQLQNPWTVLVLMLLMFVMGLSMYGIFEIGTSVTSVGGKLQTKQGVSGSFFSGILATVVATPCSAPFLGAAIGAAIALPPFQFFTAFTAMALGLSLPYLILSIFPKLVDLLPRPGAWMESFKQAMAFLLFATAGYLLWVYVGQIDLDNMLNVIFGLTAVAIAAWIFGRWHSPFRSRRVKTVALVLTVLFAAGGVKLAAPPAKSEITWEPWSQARVDELLDEGTPVYVDFTAKWCATCQLNKKRAYPKEVVALMKERGMVLMRADKTNPDPAIDAKLEELGRSAIPVNVLYVPEKDPVITPELLDAGYMKDLITREVPLPEKK
ncbi:protein-disulfide reductase DsbD family protein [Luteolibacter arcticus]|uniref:Protein-disulfide reductase DsbD family protein n=1 Tax=Luteolibacter arcticus TaxID=1581411 RepID=A0ABT3GD88_9BACT|nr:thioredoxin family protein [Luteolibacter arcticus]MCW1921595.1 protein-disulfide reductase DsbD family protein [Luteolibacter arcticus]